MHQKIILLLVFLQVAFISLSQIKTKLKLIQQVK